MSSPRSLLQTIEFTLTRVIQALAILVSIIMVGSLLIGIFYRYVLQNSLSWSDEVALLCFTWMVFLTAALAVRDNSHVRVELVEKILPARAHWLLEQLIWILIALIGAYMLWMGWQFTAFTLGQTSAAIRYPVWLRNVSLPVAGALIIPYALLQLQGFGRFQQSKEETA